MRPKMVDEDDKNLFREHVAGTRQMNNDRVEAPASRPAPRARFSQAADRDVLFESLHGELTPEELETGEELLFRRPGFPDKAFRKLRTGGYLVQAEMDLHGMNSREARSALDDFLRECARERARCVRIVHGKGKGSGNFGPVLKPKLARWLRQRDVVIAFSSATPRDGGTGAVYVLLKN